MNIYVDTAFGLYNLLSDSGGVMIGLKSIKMTGQHYICNYWQSLLTMDLLLNSNCPISIFIGLGGHGLSFFIFGEELHSVDQYHLSCFLAQLSTPASQKLFSKQ